MAKHPGKILEVIDGVHKGKVGVAFNNDQIAEVRKAGKILLQLPSGKTLIEPQKVKIIGYTD